MTPRLFCRAWLQIFVCCVIIRYVFALHLDVLSIPGVLLCFCMEQEQVTVFGCQLGILSSHYGFFDVTCMEQTTNEWVHIL